MASRTAAAAKSGLNGSVFLGDIGKTFYERAGTMPSKWLLILPGILLALSIASGEALAVPSFVAHDPTAQPFNQPADVTGREPLTPREGDNVSLWFKAGPSFSYTQVCVYYTTDGSTPNGSNGIGFGSTMVLRSAGPSPEANFQYNEGPDDWWLAQFPLSVIIYPAPLRYVISAWHDSDPVQEVFAGGSPATVFNFTVLLAWPGAGSGAASPQEGYPPIHFWKEEGVIGNNYINAMIDQNGSVYDIYYPSAGCVDGMGTKNEGYVDGLDTFPPGLPLGHRGQMNLNEAMFGLRVGGLTYWMTNEVGGDYTDLSQAYVPQTNVISTSQRLVAAGNDISVQQYDFAPKGIVFPNDNGGSPNRGVYIKRFVLTNNGIDDKTVNFYAYADFALNGGDDFDGTFTDAPRGAMVAYDNTYRNLPPGSGEYNPTSGLTYEKNVSVYLAAALRLSDAVGGSVGTPASDFWSDTSGDSGHGWVGMQVDLPAGASKELAVLFVGGFERPAGMTGTYAYQMTNAIDWFMSANLATLQSDTETYWSDWLASGVTVDTPDDAYDTLFNRSMLATALHLDGANGGVIAGMHNGAYPFVWPRDAAWAAITLDRTGHTAEADEVYRFLRDVTERNVEGGGRVSWWFQKYTTDGKKIWTSPQVDETSCFPWGVYYHYLVTGDLAFLDLNYPTVWEAAVASSVDSDHPQLYYADAVDLMYSNNLWEDSYDVFLYSNASVERGLRDAAAIANVLDQNVCPGGPGTCNYHNDAAQFTSSADAIHGGINGRLAWDGENTDISQLGLVYPFSLYDSKDPAIAHMLDRMNGVATDGFGQNHPIMNFAGEWDGLVNRYWGDTYWHNAGGPNANGSPWFLSTMWYGCYYAERQNANPDKGDIDNHKSRLDRLISRLGPIGFGAEQIAPSNSLLYAGQMDFVLETAWPNAWESMSFFLDSIMMFVGYTPDAPANTLRIEPKLPTDWPTMTFSNLVVGSHRVSVTCTDGTTIYSNAFTNETGNAVNFDTNIRVPSGATVMAVWQDDPTGCASLPFTHDPATGRVHVTGSLGLGTGSITTIRVHTGLRGDFDNANSVDMADVAPFVDVLVGTTTDCESQAIADMNADGRPDGDDIQLFVDALVP